MITADDLHFAYDQNEVLNGASLEIAPGEVVALLGPSGSGKSTLLYCLAGILVPDSGSIIFDGIDVAAADDRERSLLRRRSFGFVLQFGRLVADLTAVENVSFPLRLLGVHRSDADAAAQKALLEVGVDKLAHRRSSTLSGGEQQRVAVARALIHRPAVVFADEPTGALDSTNSALVMDCLTSSARRHGSSVVLVTHDESVAEQADRRIRLADGAITSGRPIFEGQISGS